MSARTRDAYRYSLDLTEGWYSITPADGKTTPDAGAVISQLTLPDGQDAPLRQAIDTVWEFASVGYVPGSERWILIRDSRIGRIDAVLGLDLHAAGGANGPIRYAELAEAGMDGAADVEVINRVIESHELPVGTAVAIHDFALPRPDPDPSGPASERAIVGLFLRAEPIMVEVSLVTQDLGLTDSLMEYLLRIVGTFAIERLE